MCLNDETINENQNMQLVESDQNTAFQKEMISLREEIKSLNDKISKQNEEIEQLKDVIKQLKVDVMTVEKFLDKHKVTKLSNQKALKDFDAKLSEDGEFCSDFEVCLTHLIDKDMDRTVRTIIERFMDEKLIKQCNAMNQIKDKYCLKKTKFRKVLFGLVRENCRIMGENKEEKIPESDFNKALGKVCC